MGDDGIHRTLFEHAGAGIFQSTPEGRFVRANPALARMLGYGSVGRLLAEIADIGEQLYVEPDSSEELIRALRASGRVANFVAELRWRDGQISWVSEAVTEVRRRADGQCWHVGTVVEVSELVRPQQALAEAERGYRDI